MDTSKKSGVWSRRTRLSLLFAMLAAALGAVGLFVMLHGPADPGAVSGAAEAPVRKSSHTFGSSPKAKSLAKIVVPNFGRPEERQRYLNAMIAGDRRAIDVLDAAIAEARLRSQTNTGSVLALERARDARSARLEAHLESVGGGVSP